MSGIDSASNEILVQLADIAVRRQAAREKCRAFERSEMKCSMQGAERLRKYKSELENLEFELEIAVKKWTAVG